MTREGRRSANGSGPVGGERGAGVSGDAERKRISPVMGLAILWHQELLARNQHGAWLSRGLQGLRFSYMNVGYN